MSELIDRFLEELNAESPQSPERLQILRALVTRVIELAELDPDTSDLRIASTALGELLTSAELFAAWRDRPKLTVFGSARTPPSSPLYEMARELSDEMASRGWMTVSGAGPGIMAASSKGAGRGSTLGINIELPFEHGANEFIDVEQMHVAMKYFFTRKVAMTRASRAFVAFPGGVGTMDELFEILTLVHTGKTDPAPVVLVDEPHGRYWSGWLHFMEESIIANGYLDEVDTRLFAIRDSVAGAIEEIEHFYSNFESFSKREKGASLRVRRMPSPSQLAQLTREFPMFASNG
ncbi:MAG: LOG family protein, partial [Acidimicrobiales bacterium]